MDRKVARSSKNKTGEDRDDRIREKSRAEQYEDVRCVIENE